MGAYGTWTYKAGVVQTEAGLCKWVNDSDPTAPGMANGSPCDVACHPSEHMAFWYPGSLELAGEVTVSIEGGFLEALMCVLYYVKETLKVQRLVLVTDVERGTCINSIERGLI